MRGLIRGTLLGITFCSLVAGLLAYNSKVAWVTITEYTVAATVFSAETQCQSVRYIGRGFEHEIVSGHAPLGGSSGASGGYLMEANFSIPEQVLYTVASSWGTLSSYGHESRDEDQLIAGACAKAM